MTVFTSIVVSKEIDAPDPIEPSLACSDTEQNSRSFYLYHTDMQE
jgi:hypothetical protein